MRPRPTGRSLGPTAFVLLLVACGAPAEDAATPEDAAVPPGPSSEVGLPFDVPPSVTGELVLEEGRVAFLPCGSDLPLRVRDGTGSEAASIVDDLGYGDGGVLAAVVLDRSDLVQVRFAAPEGRGCEALLPEEDLAAMGNEPFWSLRIRGDEARWVTPDAMDGVLYAPAAWTEAGPGEWVLTAPPEARDGAGEDPVVLRITPERCVDTMAGSRFPYTARVEREGRTYEGCAVEGRGPGAGGPGS